MKQKLYRLAFITMLAAAMPMFTSCDAHWDLLYGQYDNPAENIVPVSGIKIVATGLQNGEVTIATGSTLQLTAEVYPVNATERAISWTTVNDKVVTVSDTGLVTAVGSGMAIVNVASKSNTQISAKIVINVVDGLVDVTSDAIDQSQAESRRY